MGLTDSLRRLVSSADEEEEPAYECSTCGRQYVESRTVCDDCRSRVREIPTA